MICGSMLRPSDTSQLHGTSGAASRAKSGKPTKNRKTSEAMAATLQTTMRRPLASPARPVESWAMAGPRSDLQVALSEADAFASIGIALNAVKMRFGTVALEPCYHIGPEDRRQATVRARCQAPRMPGKTGACGTGRCPSKYRHENAATFWFHGHIPACP